jgi:type III pantothenate kinase
MLLAIDIGNSRIKCAVFEHDKMLAQFTFLADELEISLHDIVVKYPECKDIVVANVGMLSENQLIKMAKPLKCHFITSQSFFPFKNKYQTPGTLGIDRMVLAAGAVLIYPDVSKLVIDVGTCITYDFVDTENNYLGGAISPGIRLRYEALKEKTAKLPLLQMKYPDDFVGNCTDEAIHVGVVQGVLNEIDGFIDQYQANYANIIIILTGGDGDFLAKRLKNTIFANSNFLLESLNQTFQYQDKND